MVTPVFISGRTNHRALKPIPLFSNYIRVMWITLTFSMLAQKVIISLAMLPAIFFSFPDSSFSALISLACWSWWCRATARANCKRQKINTLDIQYNRSPDTFFPNKYKIFMTDICLVILIWFKTSYFVFIVLLQYGKISRKEFLWCIRFCIMS